MEQKIKIFFLVFLGLLIFFSKTHSNESANNITPIKTIGIEQNIPITENREKLFEERKIEEFFLGKMNLNGIGLISIERTVFPDNLWSNSSEKVLAERLNQMPELSLATTNKIFKRLLVVDAQPPLNSIGIKNMGYSFLISRIDKLIQIGALDEAEEILNYLKNPPINFMKRKIEVALINGRLTKTCNLAERYPNFTGMLQFKIICLVQKNDWQAAALAFTVGSSLNLLNEKEKNIFLNFLDPEIQADFFHSVSIEDLSPTSFYLLYGKNKIIVPDKFPHKYAYAFSRSDISPELRIRSMETLASKYIINSNTLFDLYRTNQVGYGEQVDTKNALMELQQSVKGNSDQQKLIALKNATKIFFKKNLLPQFSHEYKNILKELITSNDKRLRDLSVALLSLINQEANNKILLKTSNSDINCLMDIKRTRFIKNEADSKVCKLVKRLNVETIKKSFISNKSYNEYIEKGLILLESLSLLQNGVATKFGDLELSLSLLTKIGLIDLANEISIEFIALNTVKKMIFEK